MDLIAYMSRAIELANEARTRGDVPVGALLVHENKVLAEGFNQREFKKSSLAHAEIEALNAYHSKFASWRLPPETWLFVTVEPCLLCTGALIASRLSHVVFGCTDTKNAGLTRLLPLIEEGVFDHRFASVTPGIKMAECSEQLSSFFRWKRSLSSAPSENG